MKSVDDSLPTKRALGIDFFDGSAEEAVEWVSRNGGLVVAPAAPSFIALQDDPDYRRAIADADLAIADSGWMVNFWWLLPTRTAYSHFRSEIFQMSSGTAGSPNGRKSLLGFAE